MLRWRFTINPDSDNKEISEPKGWADLPFTLKRDRTWHGVFFEHSKELGFYDHPTNAAQDAYTFLRDEYEEKGVEGYVILKVELACSDTDDFEQEAEWRLNFTSYKETRGNECFITLNLEESDCLMTFRNRYDQPVTFNENLTFDGTQLADYAYLGFNLTLPPKTVLQQSELSSPGFVGADGDSHPPFTLEQEVSAGTGTVVHEAIGYFGFGLQPDDLDEIDDLEPTEDGTAGNAADLPPNFTIEVGGEYTITVNVQGRLNWFLTTNANNTDCSGDKDTFNHVEYQVYLEVGGTTVLVWSASDDGCYQEGDAPLGSNYEFASIPMGTFTDTYSLNAGDEIKLYVRMRGEGEWNHDLIDAHPLNWSLTFDGTGTMSIVAYTLSVPSTCVASLINEAGSRILEKITDDCIRLLSNYYGRTDSQPYPAPSGVDGCGSLRAIMCGLDIRQYTSGRLAISMKKLFDDLCAIDNIGIGLEDDPERSGYQVMRMEDWKYFYTNDIVLTKDKVPLVTIEVRQDMHYSIFKGGYAKYEAEAYLGLDEFLTERNYRTSLTSVKNTLDQVCDMIASGYAIEITRRQKLYSPTTLEDWRFDNDVFIVCLRRGESTPIEVEQGNITGGTGMIAPETLYNFRISPARNAMRWLATVLNSYRDPEAVDSEVIFTDGKGNILAEGLMTGDCIVENAAVIENQTLDYTVTDDPADALPIFLPEVWNCEIDLSMAEYEAVKANPRGTLQFRFGQEVDFRDFFLDTMEWKANDQKAVFSLLPKRTYPIDECLIYIVQTRGTGSTTFGSALLVGAALENLFIFVNGELMKYNDLNTANNEVDSWNSATGYGELTFPIPAGAQVSIFHLPPGDGRCDTCIHRFEGHGDGTTTPALTGLGSASLSNLFVFYNGQLMKYKDLNAANNEITAYNAGTEELTFNGATHPKRELRAFAFANCANIKTFSGNGDGTTTPTVSGLGLGDLSNIFVFYNGQLMKYNDSNTDNNEVTAYNAGTSEVTFNFPTHAARELRAFKLQN